MAADKNSKTEKPTPKRIKEARSEGRIAKSQELAAWASVLIGITTIKITFAKCTKALDSIMQNMANVMADPDVGKTLSFLGRSVADGLLSIAPLVIGFTVLAIVINLAQVRFVFASKAIKPSFKKMNPINGIKRLLSTQSLWQAGKELLKFFIFGAIAYNSLYGTILYLAEGGPYSISETIRTTTSSAFTFIRNVALAGLVIGVIDYIFQRRKINQTLRMTKQEVREEFKQQDVNPEIKGRIKAKQRQISRNRMMSAIKDADVVVVNPVHIAIALKYEPSLGAPKVVAKGAGFIAEKIRERAEEHKVPMVQDILLARTLHRSCDIDDEIPSAMFEAVAKVLAFVFTLKNRGTGYGLHKMPGTIELSDADQYDQMELTHQIGG